MGYCQVNNLLLLRETIMKKQLVVIDELNKELLYMCGGQDATYKYLGSLFHLYLY